MSNEAQKLKIIEDHHAVCADLCARYARLATDSGDERRAAVYQMFTRYHRSRARSFGAVSTTYHKMEDHA